MSSESIIKLTQLSRVFRTEDLETTALNQINLEILSGEFVAIMGPSGCGKSTMLNILGLLDRHNSGDFEFCGQNINKHSESALSVLRKRHIGFVFQNFNLIDNLSVFENVELPLIYQDVPKQDRRSMVEEHLEKLGIAHRANHYPRQLSGGQQQRVAVTRAIVGRPRLILADEPTGNLDSTNGNDVMDALVRLHAEGTTIVMVTHSRADAARASRVVCLSDGCLVSDGKELAHAV